MRQNHDEIDMHLGGARKRNGLLNSASNAENHTGASIKRAQLKAKTSRKWHNVFNMRCSARNTRMSLHCNNRPERDEDSIEIQWRRVNPRRKSQVLLWIKDWRRNPSKLVRNFIGEHCGTNVTHKSRSILYLWPRNIGMEVSMVAVNSVISAALG